MSKETQAYGRRFQVEINTIARDGANWVLFLDRDGVINRRIQNGYVRTWREFEFMNDAIRAISRLTAWAPHTVVLTNQQGVGKNLMSEDDLRNVHQRMREVLAEGGAFLDDVLYCTHLDSKGCVCRKPRAGMALSWLESHPEVDGSMSIMVGDTSSDMGMARNLAALTGGCTAVSIGDPTLDADLHCASLAEFAELVTQL